MPGNIGKVFIKKNAIGLRFNQLVDGRKGLETGNTIAFLLQNFS